jgi:hypothetical protein
MSKGRAWQVGRKAWDRLAGWAKDHAGGSAALDALDDVGALRRLIDQLELEAVRAARRSGRSWAEIATRLGVSRQSAWERWHELDETDPGDPAVALVARAEVAQQEARELRRRANILVPDVVGQRRDRARDLLHEAGLVAVGADPDGPPLAATGWPHGVVIDQSPESGARVPRGTAVRLWLDSEEGGSGVREPRRPVPPRPKAARELDYDTRGDEPTG